MKPIPRVSLLTSLAAAVLLPPAAGARTPSCSDPVSDCFFLRAASADVATIDEVVARRTDDPE